jgi:hypothetical protein
MADRSSGYRSQRLRQRRSRRAQSWQSVALYVLAATVAFGAVFGAVVLAGRFVSNEPKEEPDSYLALVTVGVGDEGHRPTSGLLVVDRDDAQTTFFTIPPTLLFTGSEGEYVMADDAVRSEDYVDYVERLTGVPVDRVVDMSYADLTRLTEAADVFVRLPRSLTMTVAGKTTVLEGGRSFPAASLPDLLSATGSGPDEAQLQESVFDALFTTGALRSEAERDADLDELAGRFDQATRDEQREAVAALFGGRTLVERLPSRGMTARGQFAYRPDGELIRARITRESPTYDAPYTVIVQNGSGEVGVAQAVAERLAVLDVDLGPVTNASSFDFKATQILAGDAALAAAEEVRAILGRGVVLKGRDLPDDTIVVIVGKDLKVKDLQ